LIPGKKEDRREKNNELTYKQGETLDLEGARGGKRAREVLTEGIIRTFL